MLRRVTFSSKFRDSRKWSLLASLWLIFNAFPAWALYRASTVTDVCPAQGLLNRPNDFEPGGIILTTFDRSNLWVFRPEDGRRYPLPETFPCGPNCHLSRDAQWIIYFNDITNAYNKMRLDGTERTLLSDYASDVQWWDEDTLLIWTPGHEAYLRDETGTERDYLSVNGIASIQPGGRWGLLLEPRGDGFIRALVNLDLHGLRNVAVPRSNLGVDMPYFNAGSWSPDGTTYVYVAPIAQTEEVSLYSSELFSIQPGDENAVQLTNLTERYGSLRINGLASGELSWSPDGSQIAFWVVPITGIDPLANTGNAIVHVLDLTTGELRAYCDYSTTEHTPNPPRLVWSPDGSTIAFGSNQPGDELGYLLLGLDVDEGTFTILSDGIYPALGTPDVLAWGLPPQ